MHSFCFCAVESSTVDEGRTDRQVVVARTHPSAPVIEAAWAEGRAVALDRALKYAQEEAADEDGTYIP